MKIQVQMYLKKKALCIFIIYRQSEMCDSEEKFQ